MFVDPSDLGNGPYSPAGDLSCDGFASMYLVNELLSEGIFRGRSVHAGLRRADEKQVAVEYVPINQCQFITSGTHIVPLEVALREKVNRPYRCENVVELLDWVQTPIFYILVLERPSSFMNLQSFIDQQTGRLSERQIRKIMYQVVRGAYHFFECGVSYHDFSPVNLLINSETLEVKLNDSGSIEPYSSYADLATVGKLGDLMYWLVIGHYPFGFMGDWRLHYLFNVEVSGDCLSLISYCLKQDPEERLKFDQILDHMWFQTYKHELNMTV